MGGTFCAPEDRCCGGCDSDHKEILRNNEAEMMTDRELTMIKPDTEAETKTGSDKLFDLTELPPQIVTSITHEGPVNTMGSPHTKKYATMLCHHLEEAKREGRHLKSELGFLLGDPGRIALDSNYDLENLGQLAQLVMESEVLVVLQTKTLLHCPWCLVELASAMKNDIPLVCIEVVGPASCDFVWGFEYLANLDTVLQKENPNVLELLKSHGVDIEDLCYRLSYAIVQTLTIKLELTPHESNGGTNEALMDIMEALRLAEAPSARLFVSKEEWRAQRGKSNVILATDDASTTDVVWEEA